MEWPSQRPFWPRKVEMPDSAEMPAPVRIKRCMDCLEFISLESEGRVGISRVLDDLTGLVETGDDFSEMRVAEIRLIRGEEDGRTGSRRWWTLCLHRVAC